MRARRAQLAAEPGLVREVLARGNERANTLADATLERVRDAMGMAC
jgi:tryptophanyl-tRNA synthetase